jgi:hypothetical protein
MADITVPYANAGMAAYEAGDTYKTVELFSGDTPLPVSEDFPVASGVAIAAFSVVGLSGGNLVLANTTGPIVPIGVTTAPVLNTGSAQRVAIYRAGCFNPAALTWHADYATDADKAAAFRGAPAPTNILIRKFL